MANGSPRKVIVNERAAKRLRDGHVWVYASDVLNDAGAKPGAMVHVTGPKDKILGSAIYSSSSQIKLRLVGREALRSEEELLQLVRQRLAEAVSYRTKVVHNSNACRLVFSEADRLPGLIVDRYNDVFTVQVLTQAWAAPERKQAIVAALKDFTGAENIVERADARIRELEQLPEMESGLVAGKKSSKRADVDEVAEKTVKLLKACVPAAVPGIAFLSGGQSDEEATAHLDAMNRIGDLPWKLTFSYGRALQHAPQKAWSGRSENVAAAQRAFAHRARMNGLASMGQWKSDLERKAA